ncbi:unnamed protein product [Somion occarium]|uniref:DUF2421 domain-containing protein n=1 Tax=Somion occarium TaxID=3059160 RepID=A0ABP1DG21_9APHY
MASSNTQMDDRAATPSMNIPDHGREQAQYGSIHDIVGSPEQMPDLGFHHSIPQLTHSPSLSDSQDAFQSRPSYSRSVSSPHVAPSRLPISSSFKEVTRSVLRRQDRPKEREWSVFGELMSGERHLQVPSLNRDVILENELAVPESQPVFATVETVSEPFQADDLRTDSDTDEERPPQVPSEQRSRWSLPSLPQLTPLQRNILKCSIAYFIGSLFTFSPYLSGFIADVTSYGPGESEPSPSGHMVATVAVYFNPAKTVGGMMDADTFCLMGLLYATFVSLSSMGMFWFFEVRAGWEWLADSLVVIWIGIGMSLVAWMKVWMAKPTFNTACSMTAIILFVVVVREGGVETLLQVAFIVVVGSIISNVVCYTLWPQHATRNLQGTMTKTLDSFSTLLTMIIQTFLLEEQQVFQPSQEKIQKAIESHQASFTALKKNLAEAQSERWFGGPGKPPAVRSPTNLGQAYEDAVDSLNRLGQHLNGLRSGTSLQFELIQANKNGKLVLKNRSINRLSNSLTANLSGTNSRGKSVNHDGQGSAASQTEEDLVLQAAADTFGDLLEDLDSPLKSLSSTCSSTLKRLREAFVEPHQVGKREAIGPEEFNDLAESIDRALFQFESTSNHAILRLYRKGTGGTAGTASSRMSVVSSLTDTDGSDSENIFLVYFFIFTLQEFAKELVSLVDAMGRICSIQRAEAEQRSWWASLIRPITLVCNKLVTKTRSSGSRPRLEKGLLRRRLSTMFAPESRANTVSFPKVKPHAPNTILTPAREDLSYWGRFKQSLWALGDRLKEPDMRYAFKTGMALAVLAAPAFFDSTRPIFTEYRGEWALISFFVVMSPTIGGTNFLAVHRVLGTFLGAVTAAFIWTLFPENPYALCAFGFFYSIPCFYYIVSTPQYATSARFVLLTYNLTCLYCYNVRQKDVSVIEVAYHRFVAVTVGVIWASIVSRYWWPTEARRELSKALGDFCLNMGWLYTRLVAFNSFDNESGFPRIEEDETPTEETSLLTRSTNRHLNESIVNFMAMELHLQIKLIELQGLLSQTQHEPRLKGPFPVKLYRSILTSLQTILDKLHSMRCVTSREEWHTTVRKDFIIPVNRQRRDMVGNVILYFSTLAAAFRLKSPLPPYLPPAEESRQRLVDAIRQLDVIKNRSVKGSRHLLFFAYAITMRGVNHELDYLGQTLQEAFGVIGGSREAFEALFIDEDQSAA